MRRGDRLKFLVQSQETRRQRLSELSKWGEVAGGDKDQECRENVVQEHKASR
jgi:hypothetical protein